MKKSLLAALVAAAALSAANLSVLISFTAAPQAGVPHGSTRRRKKKARTAVILRIRSCTKKTLYFLPDILLFIE